MEKENEEINKKKYDNRNMEFNFSSANTNE